jgi:hypothetical protein
MSLTLNQIITQIKGFGTNHPQLNTVLFGEFVEKLDDADIIYPAMFFDLADAAISEKQIQYNFNIYIMDRHLVETDALEVLSDTNLIMQDIVAEIRNNSNDWETGINIPITYFREADPDYLAGVRADVSLTLDSLNNRCQIP